jgi:hypothetical protein
MTVDEDYGGRPGAVGGGRDEYGGKKALQLDADTGVGESVIRGDRSVGQQGKELFSIDLFVSSKNAFQGLLAAVDLWPRGIHDMIGEAVDSGGELAMGFMTVGIPKEFPYIAKYHIEPVESPSFLP